MLIADFTSRDEEVKIEGLWQHDYGQKLQINGLDLPAVFEVHFAHKGLQEAIVQTGSTVDGISTVDIPNSVLAQPRTISAYIYLSDEVEGKTTNEIILYMNERPAPGEFETPEDVNLFHHTLTAMNKATEQIAEYAQQTSDNRTAVEQMREKALADINDAEAAQIQSIQKEGTTQVENVQAAAAEIIADWEQINENKTLINASANGIVQKAEGTTIVLTDSSDKLIRRLKTFGHTTQKTTNGAQLFDASAITEHAYISDTNGNAIAVNKENPHYSKNASDFIDVSEIENIYISASTITGQWGAFYDIDKNFVQGMIGYGKAYAVPETAHYARFTVDDTLLDIFMLNAGSTPLQWEPYTGGKPSPSPEYPQHLISAGQRITTGAQLLQLPDVEKEVNGVTITSNNGVVSLKGTCEEEINGDFLYFLVYVSAGTYTLSGGSKNVEVTFFGQAEKTQYTTYEDGNIVIMPKIKKGTTLDEKLYIMLNAGDKALPWEPYTDGKPRAVDVGIETRVTGKNLFDQEKYIQIALDANAGCEVVELDGKRCLHIPTKLYRPNNPIFEKFKKGVSYTICFSAYPISSSINGGNGFAFKYTDGTYTYAIIRINSEVKKWTNIRATTNAKKEIEKIVPIYGTENECYIDLDSIQLEEGTEATLYEPYTAQSLTLSSPNGLPGIPVTSGGNYTDENGQQWIADYRDWERGVDISVIRKRKVAEADHFSKVSINDTNAGLVIIFNDKKYESTDSYMCTFASKGREEGKIYQNPGNFVFVGTPTDTLESLKEKIGDGEILYTLSDPIETPIPEPELAAYRALHTNTPTTIIANDAEAYTEVEYIADTENYIKQNYVSKKVYTELEQRVAALEAKTITE